MAPPFQLPIGSEISILEKFAALADAFRNTEVSG